MLCIAGYGFSSKCTFLKSWIFALCLFVFITILNLALVYIHWCVLCMLIGKSFRLTDWCIDILSCIHCSYSMTEAIITKQINLYVYYLGLSKSKDNCLSWDLLSLVARPKLLVDGMWFCVRKSNRQTGAEQ